MPKRTLQLAIFTLICFIAACWWYAEVSTNSRKVLGSIIILISWYPLIRFLKHGETNYFPLMVFNMLYYSLGFGLGGFFESEYRFESRFNESEATFAQCTLIVGLLMQIVGYYVTRRSGGTDTQASIQKISNGLKRNQLVICGWLMILLPISLNLIVDTTKIPSIGVMVRLSAMAGAAVLFSLSITAKMHRGLIVCYVFVVSYILWGGLLTGLFAEGARYGMVFVIISILHSKFVHAGVISFVTLLVLVALNPVKGDYRAQAWNENRTIVLSDWEKSALLTELAYEHNSALLRGEPLRKERHQGQSLVDRLNQYVLLGIVVSRTPEVVPYWYGSTFYDLVYTLVPRIIWANKPTKRTGNDFGQRYKIISAWDDRTSVNLPWAIELYANFGAIGVAIGMYLFGVAFAKLESAVLDISSNQPGNIVMVGLFGPLAYPESSISLLWGGVVLGYVALRSGTAFVQSLVPGRDDDEPATLANTIPSSYR